LARRVREVLCALPRCRSVTEVDCARARLSDFAAYDLCLLVVYPVDADLAVALLKRLWAAAPGCSIITLGIRLSSEQHVELLAAGAVDFLSHPFSEVELIARVRRAVGEVATTPPADIRPLLDPRIEGLVGSSPAFLQQIAKLPTIAGCDAGVLISGETGTGKEVLAQAIHYLSARAPKPWVAVNCGAIALELLESELFGHVRGAFTTAHVARTGLIREAEGGSLFLDDVDCLPLAAQAKLLRFVEEREYRQVGSNAVQRADVRVIAASNRRLADLVARGAFRQDLYFRLNVLNLSLPALRERRDDIAVLALHFVQHFAREHNRRVGGLTPGALRKLLAYQWPGNVRELRHVVERAVLLSGGALLSADDLDVETNPDESAEDSFRTAKIRVIASFERSYLEQLLASHGGNVTRAAVAAKKNRRAFFELMRKHGIRSEHFRSVAL
jgi:two-component system, NtrC family, response regulator GlrR